MVTEVKRKLDPAFTSPSPAPASLSSGRPLTGLRALAPEPKQPLDGAERVPEVFPLLAPVPASMTAAPKLDAPGLEKASSLRAQTAVSSLTAPKPVARTGTAAPANGVPEQRFTERTIAAARLDPKLAAFAEQADKAYAANDHRKLAAAFAKIEGAATGQLRLDAGVAAKQAELRAEVADKLGACSIPPSEAELRKYFRTFRDAKDPQGAIEAYHRYADAYYLDAFADKAVLPEDKYWVDVDYSDPHPSAFMYSSLWSPKQCPDRNAELSLLSTEPADWKQVTEDRELINGRRLIDCDGFAFLGGELLREALPEDQYKRRYVATQAYVPPGEQPPPGHAMVEFIPVKPDVSPILVTSKWAITTDNLNPVGRARAMKMGDMHTSTTMKDAYLLMHKAYSSDSFYAGDTLSEATSALYARHGRIRNPFVMIDVKEEPLPSCVK